MGTESVAARDCLGSSYNWDIIFTVLRSLSDPSLAPPSQEKINEKGEERQRGEIWRVPIWHKQKLLLFPPFVASPNISGADDPRRLTAETCFPGSLLLFFQATSSKHICTYIYTYMNIYMCIYGYLRVYMDLALPPVESEGSFPLPQLDEHRRLCLSGMGFCLAARQQVQGRHWRLWREQRGWGEVRQHCCSTSSMAEESFWGGFPSFCSLWRVSPAG